MRIYNYEVNNNKIIIYKDGKRLLNIPVAFEVNGNSAELKLVKQDDNALCFASGNDKMTFDFYDDCIVASCVRSFCEDTAIYKAKVFKASDSGIDLVGFDRAFTPQARCNDYKNMNYFSSLPDISFNGYFSPAVLNFSIGNKSQWVSFGLLDIPDTYVCKMDEDYSFLVESCGGKKVIKQGKNYNLPRVLITFPDDEFSAVSLFRQKLIDFGEYTPVNLKTSDRPSWWNNPFVCTYGDQILEHKIGPLIDEKWVREFVDIAENDWELKEFNLVIDDSWQYYFSLEPRAEESRFPDFRGLIDDLHKRGHHVILWDTPFIDNLGNGFETRAQKLGMVSDYKFAEQLPGGYMHKNAPESCVVDYTHENARQFIRGYCEKLFGDGEGCYNADGIKVDFTSLIRNPEANTTYANAENGIGLTEFLRFLTIFREETKKVKPDAIINCTVGDPRFEHFIDCNRMHDTHAGKLEKEIRANLAVRGCPNSLIDSDGCFMFTSWMKAYYTSAVLYGIPSIYYSKQFQDFATNAKGEYTYTITEKSKLTLDDKKMLGRLVSLSKHRPDGIAQMESFGNWIIKDGDKINAVSINGETVVFYPTEKNKTGYIFTWQDREAIFIPLCGRKFKLDTSKYPCRNKIVDYARDRAILRIEPGVVYTFTDEDDGTSIDNIFRQKTSDGTEQEVVNYVNEDVTV